MNVPRSEGGASRAVRPRASSPSPSPKPRPAARRDQLDWPDYTDVPFDLVAAAIGVADAPKALVYAIGGVE